MNESVDANTKYERDIDISKLSAGIYFLLLESAGVTETVRMIKQ